MSNPMQVVDRWMAPILNAVGVATSYGPWPDGPGDADTQWAALTVGGAGQPGPIERRPQVTVTLVGRRGRPDDMLPMYDVALALLDLSDSDEANGCAMLVRPLGDPIGPGTTEHNRPFWIMTFEVILGKP